LDDTEITTLLIDWRRGNEPARDRLVGVVYDELRRMAASSLRNERPGHTLQPTALVHELYFRIFAGQPLEFNDRKHFFAVAAGQLRRILVDHARAIHTEKRLGDRRRVSLEDAGSIATTSAQDIVAVDEALEHLAALDARSVEVVELRFFAGMTEKEAAEVLGVSVATLKRDWEFARAWLLQRLEGA
jgi:RNA polymerase sigma factor (TIGR02999 family)